MKRYALIFLAMASCLAGCAPAQQEPSPALETGGDTPETQQQMAPEADVADVAEFPSQVNACGHIITFGVTTVDDLVEAGFVVDSIEEADFDNQFWYPECFHMSYGKTMFILYAYSPFAFRYGNIDEMPHRVIRFIRFDQKSETKDGAVSYRDLVFSEFTPDIAASWSDRELEMEMERYGRGHEDSINLIFALSKDNKKVKQVGIGLDCGTFLSMLGRVDITDRIEI